MKLGDIISVGAQVLEEAAAVKSLSVGESEQLPAIKTHLSGKVVQMDIKLTVLADLSKPQSST